MLNALTKQLVGVLKEHFGVDEVYVMTSEIAGEFMNVALRKLQDIDVGDEKKVFEVMNKPIIFVRLMDVRYDDGRSGFRRIFTGWGWLSGRGKYVGLRVFTVSVGYEVRIYSVIAAQSLDLISLFLQMKRSTEIEAVLNNEVGIKVPVSLLVEEIYESAMEFMLRGKGLKVYRVGGRLTALTYSFPVNIVGGRGEGWWKEIWGDISSILYNPLQSIQLKFIDDKGNVIEGESLQCLE